MSKSLALVWGWQGLARVQAHLHKKNSPPHTARHSLGLIPMGPGAEAIGLLFGFFFPPWGIDEMEKLLWREMAKNCTWWVGLGQSDLVTTSQNPGCWRPGQSMGGGRQVVGVVPERSLSMEPCWGTGPKVCLRARGCRCALSCCGAQACRKEALATGCRKAVVQGRAEAGLGLGVVGVA